MKNILITTGGTGGHIIPAHIIKEHLENDFQIYFSTDERGLKYLATNFDRTITIDTPRLNFDLYLPYRIIKLIYLVFKSFLFIKKKI